MARPRKVDEELLFKLARIHCTYEEMAHILDVDKSTLTKGYSHIIKKAVSEGKSSLKRHMWKNAESGNSTMQIWLSKNLLGYVDKIEQTNNSTEIKENKQKAMKYEELKTEMIKQGFVKDVVAIDGNTEDSSAGKSTERRASKTA